MRRENGAKTARERTNALIFFLSDASCCFRPFFYLTFAVSLFHVSLFYGHLSCYLVSVFPAQSFGKLYTCALCLSSVPCLLVFPATIVTVR